METSYLRAQNTELGQLYQFAQASLKTNSLKSTSTRAPVHDWVDVPGVYQIFTGPVAIYDSVKGFFLSMKNYDYDASIQHAFKAIGLPIALINTVQSIVLIIQDLLKVAVGGMLAFFNSVLGVIFLAIEFTLESYKICKTLRFSYVLNQSTLLKFIPKFDPQKYSREDIIANYNKFLISQSFLLSIQDAENLHSKLESKCYSVRKRACLSLQLIIYKQLLSNIKNNYFNIEESAIQKVAMRMFDFMQAHPLEGTKYQKLQEKVGLYRHNPEKLESDYSPRITSLLEENERKAVIINKLPRHNSHLILLLQEIKSIYKEDPIDVSYKSKLNTSLTRPVRAAYRSFVVERFSRSMETFIRKHASQQHIDLKRQNRQLYLSRHLGEKSIKEMTEEMAYLHSITHKSITTGAITISELDIKKTKSLLSDLNNKVKKALLVYSLGILTILSAGALIALNFIAAPVAVPATLFAFCTIAATFRYTANESFLQTKGWYWDLRKTLPNFLLRLLPKKQPKEIEMTVFPRCLEVIG